jgi:hypothetical protein
VLALPVEDLHAVRAAVDHDDTAVRKGPDRMRPAELALEPAQGPPLSWEPAFAAQGLAQFVSRLVPAGLARVPQGLVWVRE